MLKNIKIGDKIVYNRYAKKELILVESIEEIKSTRTVNGKEIETGESTKMINGKYPIRGPLFKPTPLELEAGKFIGKEKAEDKICAFCLSDDQFAMNEDEQICSCDLMDLGPDDFK